MLQYRGRRCFDCLVSYLDQLVVLLAMSTLFVATFLLFFSDSITFLLFFGLSDLIVILA
jgi:hypothetical protein